MVEKYYIEGVTQDWLLKPGMVVYVEQEYNLPVNDFIKYNYDVINDWCKEYSLTFLYVPEFYKLCGRTLMEYMTGSSTVRFDSTSIVLRYSMSEIIFSQIKGPSFLFSGNDSNRITAFLIDVEDVEGSVADILTRYSSDSRSPIEKTLFVDTPIRFRVVPQKEDDGIRFALKYKKGLGDNFSKRISKCIEGILDEDENRVLEEDDDVDMHLVDEAQKMVARLLQKGYSVDTLLALFIPMQELSTIRITKDYRIYLPLYLKDIELPPIQKAIYLLFLKHPEGIYFKELSDYEAELYQIYRKLAVRGVNTKHIGIINDVVNPLSNSINEKCSLIKKRILAILDNSLAKHYYISGGKGELKRIAINPEMIIWE